MAFPRPTYPVREFHITDADHGAVSDWKLKKLSQVEMTKAADVAQEYIQKYVTGDPIEKLPPMPFEFGGEPVTISRSLCQFVASLMMMQCGDEKYAFEDFVLMAVNMPSTFEQLTRIAGELMGEAATFPTRPVETPSSDSDSSI